MVRTRLLLTLLGTALFPLLASCVRNASAGGESPAGVAEAFVKATNDGDLEKFLSLVTEAARESLGSTSGFSISERKFEDYTIGTPELDGETARVPIEYRDDSESKKCTIHLRREAAAWRVFGVAMTMFPGGPEFTIDFESFGKMMDGIAQGMAESLGSGLRASFEEAARKQAERERTRRRRTFESMRAIDRHPERLWAIARSYGDRTALDAIRELSGELELELDAQGHDAVLSRDVSVDVRGVSRAEAIDRIARSVGLHAVFPTTAQLLESEGGESTSRGSIVLAKGPRPLPAAWTGPFLMEVTDVRQNVPHATGQLTVSVRAIGLDGAFVAGLQDYGEITTFERVVDARGGELRAKTDVHFLGGGIWEEPVWESSTSLDLKNLLRDVDEIDRVEGVQMLPVPTLVHELQWKRPAPGEEKRVGDLVARVREYGQSTSFDVTGPKEQVERLAVYAWAEDESGADIEVTFASASQWKADTTRVNVQTKEPAAVLRVKLAVRAVREYRFAITGVPLENHDKMPAKLEPLAFDGHRRPVDVSFLRFVELGNGPATVRLRAVNHSNKTAMSVAAEFVYLSDVGKTLKDFPTTIQGEFTAAGYGAVAEPRSTNELDATAFFMPAETRGIRIRVKRVEFVDGSTWSAPE